jgi:diaminohydroxyphosphoribosylaminopyrimidine deaminase / 5-amino-6-(5-phosphoribosylamino)uracil reductase
VSGARGSKLDVARMAMALAEARKGLGRTSPNPAVGCVIARGTRVLAVGHHRRAGGPHAEVVSLRSLAARDARGATVYVTLEPCCHHGKTPPCTDALIAARPARVVVGTRDPNPRVAGRGIRALRAAGIGVTVGVLEEECQEVIRGFAHWIRTGEPWVQLKLAASLDGRIATRTGASKWISSAESRRSVQQMRARADAVLVGVGTVLADDPRLTCRLAGATQPLRVILDHELRTPAKARVVTGPGSCLLVCAPGPAAGRRRSLAAAGAEVLELPTGERAGWRALLRELGRRGMHEVLVEGGGAVAASALRSRVVNGLTFFYNPRLIGGDGIAMIGPLGVVDPKRALTAVTVSWRASGPDLVWNGVIK